MWLPHKVAKKQLENCWRTVSNRINGPNFGLQRLDCPDLLRRILSPRSSLAVRYYKQAVDFSAASIASMNALLTPNWPAVFRLQLPVRRWRIQFFDSIAMSDRIVHIALAPITRAKQCGHRPLGSIAPAMCCMLDAPVVRLVQANKSPSVYIVKLRL